jgi:tRNA threonylcarbamoyladenosine biosynthesis protein TsaE
MDLALRSGTADDTRRIGEALADLLRPHDVVVLTGELGAGKTTLVQGLAHGLGATEHVTSPTFTLVREYVTGRVPVAHVDVYRLERVQDVVDLTLEELLEGEGVLLVEWGDAVEELLAPDRLRVELTGIDPSGGSEERRIELTSTGPSWEARWEGLEHALGAWEEPT